MRDVKLCVGGLWVLREGTLCQIGRMEYFWSRLGIFFFHAPPVNRHGEIQFVRDTSVIRVHFFACSSFWSSVPKNVRLFFEDISSGVIRSCAKRKLPAGLNSLRESILDFLGKYFSRTALVPVRERYYPKKSTSQISHYYRSHWSSGSACHNKIFCFDLWSFSAQEFGKLIKVPHWPSTSPTL